MQYVWNTQFRPEYSLSHILFLRALSLYIILSENLPTTQTANTAQHCATWPHYIARSISMRLWKAKQN